MEPIKHTNTIIIILWSKHSEEKQSNYQDEDNEQNLTFTRSESESGLCVTSRFSS